jgi:two-component system OmpR family sensor kinase
VTVAVRDTGPGISPEEQRQVFDRFYRGSLAESGHIPGTGLGLSIVEEIMRAHGGRATVESTLDQGSTFTLWLWPGSAERLRRVSNPEEEARRNLQETIEI